MSYTKQQVFDKAVSHVLAQGVPSGYMDEERTMFQCMYRHETESGKVLMCAAGALIPDQLFDPAMETTSFASLVDQHLAIRDLFADGDARHVMVGMQSAHDRAAQLNADFISSFRLRAGLVADRYSLNRSVLNQEVAP